jgi:hypothetical protein
MDIYTEHLLRKIEHLENQVDYLTKKSEELKMEDHKPMMTELYFSGERSTWFLENIGELPYVEMDGVKVHYTDMYLKIEGRVAGKPKDAIFLGEVDLSKHTQYTPEQYSEIWEKDA